MGSLGQYCMGETLAGELTDTLNITNSDTTHHLTMFRSRKQKSELHKSGLKSIIKRKRTASASKGLSRDRSSLTRLVSSPLPGTCPSCRMPYDRSQKRRLVDSCGHERCYSCIGRNDGCSVCKQTGDTFVENTSSLMETSLSSSVGLPPVTQHSKQCDTRQNTKQERKMGEDVLNENRKKRPRLLNNSLETSVDFTSSPDNTLPRRRKEVSRRNSHELQKSKSSNSVESQTATRPTHASLFSSRLSKLSTGHLYSHVLQPKFPKPLYFEVPQCPPAPLVGRQWMFHEMRTHLSSHLPTNRGVILAGGPGTGKTACILAMVERSCFGNRKQILHEDDLSLLSSHIVAYHFCQADNAPTCLIPEFVHSISAQMSQAPQLSPYFQLLQSDQAIQAMLSLASCNASPSKAMVKGILEPLNSLSSTGKIPATMCIIVLDGLCEAEQHRPEYGHTLASFLVSNLPFFPSWLKIVCTVRSSLVHIAREMVFHQISLDSTSADERLNKDLSEYITTRVRVNAESESSNRIKKNTTQKLTKYLISKACGSFLYVKQVLDFIEKGLLVVKAGSFRVLPENLSEFYQLAFNIKFPSSESFSQVHDILSISLASLQPLNLQELFFIFSALYLKSEVGWNEFNQRYQLISELLVMRQDGSVMCFHPTLRDWLLRKKEGELTKFQCDIRKGHEAIALSMIRQPKNLKPEKVLVLVHHILKSNIYKNIGQEVYFSHRDLQSYFVSLATDDVSLALGCTRNIFSPISKVSRLLLLSGANPNHVTDHIDHSTLLGMYSFQGNPDMVSLLLEYGADPNIVDDNGVAPLALACGGGHLDVVVVLVQCGALINQVDNAGVCALVMAAQKGELPVLEYLLAQEWPHQEFTDQPGLDEALQQAIIASTLGSRYEVMEMLLDLPSIDINKVDTLTHLTPLCAAATVGNTKSVRILMKRQACLDQVDEEHQQAPLHCAAKEGHCDLVNYFLSEGASHKQQDGRGRTPLMLAVSGGHAGVVNLLILHGAGLEDFDKEGITPLIHSIISNHSEIAHCLLQQGAVVNAVDSSGRSPLDIAVYQGHEEMVEVLLDNGANMEKPDLRGIKPLDRVIGFGNAAVATVFLRNGAKLGPATWVMAEGKPEIQMILLNKLLEDGNTLYRQNKLVDAAHRYSYAIKRLPNERAGWEDSFLQLEIPLFLNLSRCERRQGHQGNAANLASQVVASHPLCVEAFIARAKALKAMGMMKEALVDYSTALEIVPNNRDIEKSMKKLKEEMGCESQLVELPSMFGSSDSIRFIDDCSTVCSSNNI